jgi:hypothetical protein
MQGFTRAAYQEKKFARAVETSQLELRTWKSGDNTQPCLISTFAKAGIRDWIN